MSETQAGKGSCLCGKTKIFVKNIGHSIGACHCSMCRQWVGGPLLVVDCGSDVTFEGQENISVYASSVWAERGFCNKCGSHLFYRMKKNSNYRMPVGLFENINNLTFDLQVFIDEKPSYYCFSNDTKNMTGREVIAQFSSQA